MIIHYSGEWWVVVGVGGKGLMILVFKLHKQYMIGYWIETRPIKYK